MTAGRYLASKVPAYLSCNMKILHSMLSIHNLNGKAVWHSTELPTDEANTA
jgi:hypothetical protein